MFAQVIVDVAHSQVDRLFTYSVPQALNVELGQHVLLPFGRGNKEIEGFVVGLSSDAPEGGYVIKSITRVIEPYPVFTKEQLELARWMQKSYHCLLVDALRLMIPAQLRGGRIKEKTLRTVCLTEDLELNETRKLLLKRDGTAKAPRQLEVFDLLARVGAPMAIKDIAEFLPGSQGAVDALLKKGFLVEQGFVTFRRPDTGKTAPAAKDVALTPAQQAATDRIMDAMNAQKGQTLLLHGVTGSGKTEVYMRCIQACMDNNMQAILLVPEIALTPQTMGLFRTRFGESVALLHSRLSAGERFDEWRRIRLGAAKVAVGARSAVFAPFSDIGLIVIDEEHEQSYQSEQTPRYHTLEVARRRTAFFNAPLVLGSATPSLQSYYRAKYGIYELIELPERVQSRPMPDIDIVDMRDEFAQGNNSIFSARLHQLLGECLSMGKQAILFLNRRGYSTFVSCRGCGFVFECPNCDVSMTYHRAGERLKCHYCGHNEALPGRCPSCGRPYVKLFGVGTQQVEEQLIELFPGTKTLRMDLDTTRTKDAHERMFKSFAVGEAQVLIGTQMVAKGLDFPNVTLVGVVAADSGLHIPDYRAGERTFQLLMQVAGRAGRDTSPGRVVVQTYTPEHPSIVFAAQHDYKGYFLYELMQRRAALFPPFALFLRALLVGEDEERLQRECEELGQALERVIKSALGDEAVNELMYLKASFAPMQKKQGLFRYQVLVKLLRTGNTARVLRAVYDYLDENSAKQLIRLEINPGDLF
ncbi:primosomal protein N' [Eubacteriales bacterium OttesenSCG-928-K08]|nr:primosomal protein N' [Eubacteriales bacterium OttesenSCG-928-K08]